MWMCSVCRFDITEVQICLAGIQLLTTTVGPSLWNVMVNLLAAACMAHCCLPPQRLLTCMEVTQRKLILNLWCVFSNFFLFFKRSLFCAKQAAPCSASCCGGRLWDDNVLVVFLNFLFLLILTINCLLSPPTQHWCDWGANLHYNYVFAGRRGRICFLAVTGNSDRF